MYQIYTSVHNIILLLISTTKSAKSRITRNVSGDRVLNFVTPIRSPAVTKGGAIIWFCSAENNTKKALSTIRSHTALYIIILLFYKDARVRVINVLGGQRDGSSGGLQGNASEGTLSRLQIFIYLPT